MASLEEQLQQYLWWSLSDLGEKEKHKYSNVITVVFITSSEENIPSEYIFKFLANMTLRTIMSQPPLCPDRN